MTAATAIVSLPTAQDTHAFGAALGAIVRAGDLIVLNGPLGAGKTALTQGIAAGMGVRGRVASPTFVIARVHPPLEPGRATLVHVDAYRLGSLGEVDDLDLDVAVAESVTVVEWGAGLVEQLADARLTVDLQRAVGSEERTATLTPVGGDWAARLRAARLAAQLGGPQPGGTQLGGPQLGGTQPGGTQPGGT